MKSTVFVKVILIFCLLNCACAKPDSDSVPLTKDPENLVHHRRFHWLRGTWRGTIEPYDKDEIFLSEDGSSLSVTWYRQVGREGDQSVPFPTVCVYRYQTNEFNVVPDSKHFLENGKVYIRFDVQKASLVSHIDNSPACAIFVSREQETRPGYGIRIEPNDNDSLFASGVLMRRVH